MSQGDMKVIKHRMEGLTHGERVVLCFMTDIHLGSIGCDEHALRADVEWIANTPNAIPVLGGDLIEAQNRRHNHYQEDCHAQWLYGQHDTVGKEIEMLAIIMKPIAHKIPIYVSGNHENNQKNYADRNVYYEIARELTRDTDKHAGDIMGGYNAYLHLSFSHDYANSKGNTWAQSIFIHHGHGGGRSAGAPQNLLNGLMQSHHADLYLVGHLHQRAYHQRVTTELNSKGTLIHKTRIGVMSASYVKSGAPPHQDGTPRITYADVKAYPHSPTGCTPIVFSPAQRQKIVMMGEHRTLAELFPNGI